MQDMLLMQPDRAMTIFASKFSRVIADRIGNLGDNPLPNSFAIS
jgi:hypothetical protein